ncbi:MAG: hypothetical protein ABI480_13905 [Chitinophagaceae bacterium]
MKKLFIVLAVSSLGFVACNNEAATDTTTADSLLKDSLYRDSVMKATPPPAMPDSTTMADSGKMMKDSAASKMKSK